MAVNLRNSIISSLNTGLRQSVTGGPGAEPTLWTPSELTGLTLWLDADDAATITESSGSVTQWDDKSGNGNHMTNTGSGSVSPAYLTTGFNNMPTLNFGFDDYLGNSSPSGLDGQGDFFYASVFKFSSSTGQWAMIMGGRHALNSAGSAGIPLLQRMKNTDQIGMHDSDRADTRIKVDVTDITQGHVATLGRTGGTDGNGGSVTVTASGASGSYLTTDTQTWNSGANAVFQIGGRQQSTTSWTLGLISECIAMQRNATTEERQKVVGYLSHKWGLTADLPSDHPYKSSAPTV